MSASGTASTPTHVQFRLRDGGGHRAHDLHRAEPPSSYFLLPTTRLRAEGDAVPLGDRVRQRRNGDADRPRRHGGSRRTRRRRSLPFDAVGTWTRSGWRHAAASRCTAERDGGRRQSRLRLRCRWRAGAGAADRRRRRAVLGSATGRSRRTQRPREPRATTAGTGVLCHNASVTDFERA